MMLGAMKPEHDDASTPRFQPAKLILELLQPPSPPSELLLLPGRKGTNALALAADRSVRIRASLERGEVLEGDSDICLAFQGRCSSRTHSPPLFLRAPVFEIDLESLDERSRIRHDHLRPAYARDSSVPYGRARMSTQEARKFECSVWPTSGHGAEIT